MLWARLLACVTGTVNQELLLRNEYLAAENRILRGQIKGRLRLSEGEKVTLAEIAHRLGRKALEDVAATAKPDTILGWYRKLIANKFDGSKLRRSVGCPKVDQETERLVVQMARENPGWGYDRIVGALANLGHRLSDQTVGNILGRHGISPAPKRKQSVSWKDFIRAHRDVLAGIDFFTTEVLTLKALTTYYARGKRHKRRLDSGRWAPSTNGVYKRIYKGCWESPLPKTSQDLQMALSNEFLLKGDRGRVFWPDSTDASVPPMKGSGSTSVCSRYSSVLHLALYSATWLRSY